MGIRTRAFIRLIRAHIVLAPLIFTFVRDVNRFVLFGSSRDLSEEQHRERARRLTDAFERLGITYIKLAQFLTTRPDLMPPLYLDEMSRLQDDVEPEPFPAIRDVVEEELGPLEENFDFFDEEPISGASIGQVHRAGIRTGDGGEEVAVKVRRPDIVDEMEADMIVLSKVIPLAVFGLKLLGQESHAESAEGITQELDRTIRQEMDFDRERDVMAETRSKFVADGLDDELVIPKTYPEYSTERVLTMKYEPGVKITDLETIDEMGHDIEEIVEVIVDSYLRMPFVYQCYQSDPHHGNIAVNEAGQVIIYDFGISHRPDDELVDAFIRFFTGLGLENSAMAVEALIDMDAMDPAMDRATLEEVVDGIIADISGGGLSANEMSQIEEQVDQALYDYPLTLHQDIVLPMRTTFGVEGLSAKVAPGYDFSAKLASFFVEQDLVDVDFEEYEDVDHPDVNEAAIKREINEAAKANGKRTIKSTVGATMVVSASVLFVAGSSLLLTGAVGLVGILAFVSAARSFGDDDAGATGPMIATRANMEKWEDDDVVGTETSDSTTSRTANQPARTGQSSDVVADGSGED